jgi:hypothetical protein
MGGISQSSGHISLQLSELVPKHEMVHCKSGKKISDKGRGSLALGSAKSSAHTSAKPEKIWGSAYNFRRPSLPISAHSQTAMLQFCGPFVRSTISTRLPIAKPMLVDRLRSDGVWRLEHTIVDFKLFHEAAVGSAYGTAFTQLREGFVR